MVELSIWKDLRPEEVREFVEWALDNWTPNTQINKLWHPVVRNTWGKLDEAFSVAKKQILADFKDLAEAEHARG